MPRSRQELGVEEPGAGENMLEDSQVSSTLYIGYRAKHIPCIRDLLLAGAGHGRT